LNLERADEYCSKCDARRPWNPPFSKSAIDNAKKMMPGEDGIALNSISHHPTSRLYDNNKYPFDKMFSPESIELINPNTNE
jgi:hypothetical protein